MTESVAFTDFFSSIHILRQKTHHSIFIECQTRGQQASGDLEEQSNQERRHLLANVWEHSPILLVGVDGTNSVQGYDEMNAIEFFSAIWIGLLTLQYDKKSNHILSMKFVASFLNCLLIGCPNVEIVSKSSVFNASTFQRRES